MNINLLKPVLLAAPPSTPADPPTATGLAMHTDFAGEAARAAQRYYDLVAQIAELTKERDEWRNRALLAEGQAIRADQREAVLLAQVEQKTEQALAARDIYKTGLAKVEAHYDAASKILLEGYDVIRSIERESSAKRPPTTPSPEQEQQRQDQLAGALAELNAAIQPGQPDEGPSAEEVKQ